MLTVGVATFGLAACAEGCSVRQGAYAALADYSAALAAADSYLCVNAGDSTAPCQPRPDCGGVVGSGCVIPGLRQSIQTAVADADPYAMAARILLGQPSLSRSGESGLASLVASLDASTAELRVQVLAGKDGLSPALDASLGEN
jgi:hypothetical protein